MKANKQLKISIRRFKVPTDRAKSALTKFFENWAVCPKCKGAGFFDKNRQDENLPEYTSIHYGDIEGVDNMIEHVENASNEIKNIIYRELKIRTTCTCCNGEKYIRRVAGAKVK